MTNIDTLRFTDPVFITGMHKNVRRSGCPWCTISKEDRFLLWTCKSKRTMTVPKLLVAWRNYEFLKQQRDVIWPKKQSQGGDAKKMPISS